MADRRAASSPIFADYDPRKKENRLKSFARRFVFPDRFVGWQRRAARIGRELVEGRKFDAILASFPPASTMLLALELSRATPEAALVLDFRDRWLGPGGYEPADERMRRRHCELERSVIKAASVLIVVSNALAEAISSEQGFSRDRIIVVPNGYEPRAAVERVDPADEALGEVSTAQKRPDDDTPSRRTPDGPLIAIAHVGTVIARNRPDLFFDSVLALKSHPCLTSVRFKFVGNLSREYLASAGLSDIIETTGLLRLEAAREAMQDADALLLLTGSYVGRWGNNAKLFEYIQTGRPILCLEETPGSNDRKLLERFLPDRSFFAPVGDPDAIAEQLMQIGRHVNQRPTPALELDVAFRDYSRPALAAVLAERLDALLETNRPESRAKRR